MRWQVVASELMAPKAYVEGWLWDTTAGQFDGTNHSTFLARFPIANLDTPQELAQNLRYT
jgi:hypothetical protein